VIYRIYGDSAVRLALMEMSGRVLKKALHRIVAVG